MQGRWEIKYHPRTKTCRAGVCLVASGSLYKCDLCLVVPTALKKGLVVGLTTHTYKNVYVKKRSQPRINKTDHGNRPQQRKRTNDLTLGTWNVRTLLRAGAMQEAAMQMSEFHVDILALQELPWKGQGEIRKKEYRLFYSGMPNKSGQCGTGFLLSQKMSKYFLGFTPINERLCSLRIKGEFNNVTIFSIYAPTEEADDLTKDSFYAILESSMLKTCSYDTIIVLGDFNARIGKEEHFRRVAGPHSLHNVTSCNGERLCQFATSTNMYLSSTHFPHKNIHKGTWTIPGTSLSNQIDHVLISRRWKSSITDVHSCRSANIDSDHFLVKIKFNHRITMHKQEKGSTRPKWNTGQLARPTNAKIFQNLFLHQYEPHAQSENIDAEWENIKLSLTNAATESIGKLTKTENNKWFDAECAQAIAKKNEARQRMLRRPTRASKAAYKAERVVATKLCRAKRKQSQRRELEQLVTDYHTKDIRKFYKRVKQQTKDFLPRLNICKDKNGVILSEESSVIERWKEFFSDLYNPVTASASSLINFTPDNNAAEPEPTLMELDKAITHMSNNKAPGEDGIPIELLKYLDDNGRQVLLHLFLRIWHRGSIPEAWRVGLVTPIHKKGDKLNCENYRGITLLNSTYKIFSRILASRLTAEAEKILGEYQGGFRPGRSTTDQIFMLKQNLEKCYECNLDVHILFVDFKQAFDSILRDKIPEALSNLGISDKLIQLVMATLTNTTGKVVVQQAVSKPFEISCGVKQGDSLSTSLFNLLLHYAIKNEVKFGNLFSRSGITIAYADDIAIVARNKRYLIETFCNIEFRAKSVGLRINEGKTKYLKVSRSEERRSPENIQIGTLTFEGVQHFKYLGVLIKNDNSSYDTIQDRIMAANKAYYAHTKLLKSKLLTRECKLRLYQSIILPVLSYGCECWTLTSKDESSLRVFERKVLRRVFGPIRCNDGTYRIRYNDELLNLCQGEDVVKYIKSQRLRWLGHTVRMEDSRPQKSFLTTNCLMTRARGRPRLTWLDQAIADLKKLRVRSWRSVAMNRADWKRIVDEAKAHPEL